MNQISLTFLIILMFDAILHIVLQKNRTAVLITKPFLIPLLVLYYGFGNPGENWLLIIGALFGWGGDVLLMWAEKPKMFMFGLLSFMVGHFFYIATFLLSIETWSVNLLLGLIAIPIFIGYSLWFVKKIKDGAGKMYVPVIVYIVVIEIMSFTALLRAIDFGILAGWTTFIGSLFFIISDSIIAWNKFVKEIKEERILVMTTYILAQFLIVQGFF